MISFDARDIGALEAAFDWMRRLDPRPAGFASLRQPSAIALHFYGRPTGSVPDLPEGAAVLVAPGVAVGDGLRPVRVDEPRRVFARLTRVLRDTRRTGDSRSGDGGLVSRSASIGMRCQIEPGAVIGASSVIGDDCVIESGAVIRSAVRIGPHCRILSNAVVGSDGFGYALSADSWPEPIAHLGGVEIGPFVDVGPGACIAAGTIDATVIGEGTKIEGHAYVGHNAVVGAGAMICAHAVVGGSSVIGDRVWLHPGALVKNGLTVESAAIIGMGAVVMKPVPANAVMMGTVADDIRLGLRRAAVLNRIADRGER